MKCRECENDRLHGALCEICYGSGEARYVPIPDDPWNEIAEGIFQGGSMQPCWQEFDAVFTCTGKQGTGPAPGVPHTRLLIPDGTLVPAQFEQVVVLATQVAEHARDGQTVLVRCRAGLNRSGLVTALALTRLGYGPNEAIRLIREKRSPWALCNEGFERYVRLFG